MQEPDVRHCLNCGYILEGLPENRCPECGRPFDPTDPRTYARRLRSGAGLLVTALVADGLIVASVVGAGWFMSVAEIRGSLLDAFTLLAVSVGFLVGLVLAAYAMAKSASRLWHPPPILAKRRVVAVALVVAALPYLILAGLIIGAFAVY